jgi:hypothetical protein
MAIPRRIETGIPETGTARADESTDATWKPTAEVAAERATPGSLEGLVSFSELTEKSLEKVV